MAMTMASLFLTIKIGSNSMIESMILKKIFSASSQNPPQIFYFIAEIYLDKMFLGV